MARLCNKPINGYCNLPSEHGGHCAISPTEPDRRPKIVQVAAGVGGNHGLYVVALDDRGRVWGWFKGDTTWTAVPALPAQPAGEAGKRPVPSGTGER